MTKYLILWQFNPALLQLTGEERVKLLIKLSEMIKENIKNGIIKDWGMSPDESIGYIISEQTEKELYAALLPFVSYISFKVHPMLSVNEVLEEIKNLPKQIFLSR